MGGTERAEHEHETAEAGPVPMVEAPELIVGAAFDPAEQEAEQVAERVLARLSAGSAGDEHVHEQAAPVSRLAGEPGAAAGVEGGVVDRELAGRISGAKGSGAPLPDELRRTLEGAMDADLSGVRIHTGASAANSSAAIGARAFTTGNDIFFGAGEFAPDTEDGLRTIAHEVTHTLQNSGSVQRRLSGALAEAKDVGGPGIMIVRPPAPATKKTDTDGAQTDEAEKDTDASPGTAEVESADTDEAVKDTDASPESPEVDSPDTDEAIKDNDVSPKAAEVDVDDATKDGADKAGLAAAAAGATRVKLTAWDNVLNELADYEKDEAKLVGNPKKTVDDFLVARSEFLDRMTEIRVGIAKWQAQSGAEDEKVRTAHDDALRAIEPRLETEEKQLLASDPTVWLENMGFGDEERFSDGSVGFDGAVPDRTPAAGTEAPAAERPASEGPASEGPASDQKDGPVTDEQLEAVEAVEEKLGGIGTAPVEAALGEQDVKDSPVAEAVAELEREREDVKTADDAERIDAVERVLAKVQVIDALGERLERDREETKTADDGVAQDAAETTDAAETAGAGTPVLDVTGDELGAAIVELLLDDLKTALADVLPVAEIEAIVHRAEELKAEVEAEIEARVQEVQDAVQDIRDRVDASVDEGKATLAEIEELLHDPVTLAAAAGELVVPGLVQAALAQKEHYEKLGVESLDELKTDVAGVVDGVLHGIAGAAMRPDLESAIGDLPAATVKGIEAAMAAPGGPNDVIAEFIALNKVEPAKVVEVVEVAMNTFLDKSIVGSLKREAEAKATATAAGAQAVLSSAAAGLGDRLFKSLRSLF